MSRHTRVVALPTFRTLVTYGASTARHPFCLAGEALEHTMLVPNVVLRGLIRELLEAQPELVTGAAFANV